MSGTRTEAACLAASMAEIPQKFTYAYGYGYLEGVIKTAIIRLEYASPEAVITELEKALAQLAMMSEAK